MQEFISTAQTSEEKAGMIGDMLWVLLNTAECAMCP
jgi:hypothetical protein